MGSGVCPQCGRGICVGCELPKNAGKWEVMKIHAHGRADVGQDGEEFGAFNEARHAELAVAAVNAISDRALTDAELQEVADHTEKAWKSGFWTGAVVGVFFWMAVTWAITKVLKIVMLP